MLSVLDLALTSVACGLWYLWPVAGPWPLLLIAAGRLMRTLILGRSAWRPTPFDGPLLLFGVTAIVGALLAYDPIAGWGKFWVIVGGLAFYDSLARGPQTACIAGCRLSPPRLALALLPALIAAYFLLTTDWPHWLGKLAWLDPLLRGLAHWQPALPGHRLHPNVAGGLIAGLLPLQVAAIGRRKVGWPLIALAAFCLLTTASRGAWAALATGLAGWLLLARRSAGGARGASAPPIAAGVLVLIAAAVGAAVSPVGASLAAASADRLSLLRNSLHLALDTPFTGLGLASFQMAYSSYVLMLHVGHTFHSHNLLLDLWIEQGAVGLAAFAWLVGVSWWGTVVGHRSLDAQGQAAGDGRWWQGAALASLGIILLHGLVDDAFYGSRGVLLLFAPFATLGWGAAAPLLQGTTSPPAPLLQGTTSPPAPLLQGTTSPPAPLLQGTTSPPAPLLQGTTSPPAPLLQGEGRWGGKLTVAAIIAALFLALALLPAARAMFQANLGALLQTRAELSVYRWPIYPLQDALRRQAPGSPAPVDLAPAIGRYRAALALDPHNVAANRRLGQIELSQGAYEAAAAHLVAAYRVAPGQQAVRFLAGESVAIAGRTAEAAALWATVGDPQWLTGAGRQAFDLRAWWYGAIGEMIHQQRIELVIRQLTAAR